MKQARAAEDLGRVAGRLDISTSHEAWQSGSDCTRRGRDGDAAATAGNMGPPPSNAIGNNGGENKTATTY
jgi:hypothetical protein